MRTTGFEILNVIYAANISLQYIIDIDINNHMNIEVVHSNNTMITKLQNSLPKYTNTKQ